MPYIKEESRKDYNDLVDQIVKILSKDDFVNGAGDINRDNSITMDHNKTTKDFLNGT